MSKLSEPHLHDEAEAYRFVERILWPHGPVCPRCGSLDRIGKLNGNSTLAEFDFRYNARSALGVEDLERAEKALRGVSGKRLTYRKARPGCYPASGSANVNKGQCNSY